MIAANLAAALLGCEREALLSNAALTLAATPETWPGWDRRAATNARRATASCVALRRPVPVARSIEPVQIDSAPPSSSPCTTAARSCAPSTTLELAAAELAATLESTADGMLVTDLSGASATANRRFADLWALPE